MEAEMDVSDRESDSEDDTKQQTAKVYLPGQEIKDDEELVCDESAYMMYHQAQTGF